MHLRHHSLTYFNLVACGSAGVNPRLCLRAGLRETFIFTAPTKQKEDRRPSFRVVDWEKHRVPIPKFRSMGKSVNWLCLDLPLLYEQRVITPRNLQPTHSLPLTLPFLLTKMPNAYYRLTNKFSFEGNTYEYRIL